MFKTVLHLFSLLMLFSSAIFASSQLMAQVDESFSNLTIPCVQVLTNGKVKTKGLNGDPALYQVDMVYSGSLFHVTRAAPINLTRWNKYSECTGTYETSSGLYSDIVLLDNDPYALQMVLVDEQRNFRIELFELQSAVVTTSLWRVDDGNNELFVGGAVHILKNSDYPLPELSVELMSN